MAQIVAVLYKLCHNAFGIYQVPRYPRIGEYHLARFFSSVAPSPIFFVCRASPEMCIKWKCIAHWREESHWWWAGTPFPPSHPSVNTFMFIYPIWAGTHSARNLLGMPRAPQMPDETLARLMSCQAVHRHRHSSWLLTSSNICSGSRDALDAKNV